MVLTGELSKVSILQCVVGDNSGVSSGGAVKGFDPYVADSLKLPIWVNCDTALFSVSGCLL